MAFILTPLRCPLYLNWAAGEAELRLQLAIFFLLCFGCCVRDIFNVSMKAVYLYRELTYSRFSMIKKYFFGVSLVFTTFLLIL